MTSAGSRKAMFWLKMRGHAAGSYIREVSTNPKADPNLIDFVAKNIENISHNIKAGQAVSRAENLVNEMNAIVSEGAQAIADPRLGFILIAIDKLSPELRRGLSKEELFELAKAELNKK